MKKLITLIAGLLLVALPVGLAGCDDSDKEIYNDGRLVTDVVIPTSMTVYRGMEVSVSGYGFAQGDAIALRAGEDLPAATTVASEKLLTFVIPDGAADQTVYKVVLNRAQDYQVLGSSKMTVQLAIDVDLGKTISGNWGGDAVIRGRGFMATDKLLLEQGYRPPGRTRHRRRPCLGRRPDHQDRRQRFLLAQFRKTQRTRLRHPACGL